jgi:histone chaperone ASF1
LQAVLDNPASFLSPFSFEITFECLQPLSDDLEWKVLYVGSAEILVGPIPVGINKFVLQADAPNIAQIPEGDILGVTVVLVTCSYREKEFVRVGYYVNNEYMEEYDEEVGPPKPLNMNKVRRSVLAEKPRVTRFPIQWGDNKDEEIENVQQNGQVSMEGQTMEEAKMARLNGGGEDSMMVDAVTE